jgi:hypothetical protein
LRFRVRLLADRLVVVGGVELGAIAGANERFYTSNTMTITSTCQRRALRCDFEVLAVEDSEQGCKLAVTEHPDVILIVRTR